MKKLMTILMTGLLVSAFAQNNENDKPDPDPNFNVVQEQVQAKINNAIKNMPEELQKKVQAAVQEAEAAKKQIQQMINSGKPANEIEAMQIKAKEQAEIKLNLAVQNMENVSAQLKGQIEVVKEQIRLRLEEKIEELKKSQEQHKIKPNEK